MKKKGKEERVDRVTVQLKKNRVLKSNSPVGRDPHLTARAVYRSSPVMSHLLVSVERQQVAWLLCKLGGAYRGQQLELSVIMLLTAGGMNSSFMAAMTQQFQS